MPELKESTFSYSEASIVLKKMKFVMERCIVGFVVYYVTIIQSRSYESSVYGY